MAISSRNLGFNNYAGPSTRSVKTVDDQFTESIGSSNILLYKVELGMKIMSV